MHVTSGVLWCILSYFSAYTVAVSWMGARGGEGMAPVNTACAERRRALKFMRVEVESS